MGWKNWLIGGVIGIIIYVILLFSTLGYMGLIMGSIFDILGISSKGGNSFDRFYNFWLLPFITFFIIGAIIGFIIGKIKIIDKTYWLIGGIIGGVIGILLWLGLGGLNGSGIINYRAPSIIIFVFLGTFIGLVIGELKHK